MPQFAPRLPASGSWDIRSTVAIQCRPKAETFRIAPKLMLVSTPDLTWEGIRGCVVVPAPAQPSVSSRSGAGPREPSNSASEPRRSASVRPSWRWVPPLLPASPSPGNGFPFMISVTPRKSACVLSMDLAVGREGNPNPTEFSGKRVLLAYITKLPKAGSASGMAGSRDLNTITKTQLFSVRPLAYIYVENVSRRVPSMFLV